MLRSIPLPLTVALIFSQCAHSVFLRSRNSTTSAAHRFDAKNELAADELDRLKKASTYYDGFVEENDGDKLLFIGVHSAPGNAERRQEIRDSWMQDLILRGDDSIIKTKFIIGDNGHDLMDELTEENRKYNDIVFLKVNESYHNLATKTIAYFRWFARESEKVCAGDCWFVMKLDDDTWPNLDLLLPVLVGIRKDKSKIDATLNYIGAELWNGAVVREGKWAETAPLSQFNAQQYPAYMAGSGYILSKDLVKRLDTYIANNGITLLRNEDTTVGNWIHDQNHLNMNIHYQDLTWKEQGCGDGQHLMMNLCPGEMRCMWQKRLNGTASGDGASVCCNPPEDYGLPANGCDRGSEA